MGRGASSIPTRHSRTAVDKPKQASAYAFSQTVRLEDVPAGRYTIHVEARSSLDRRRSTSRDIPFAVR